MKCPLCVCCAAYTAKLNELRGGAIFAIGSGLAIATAQCFRWR